MDGAIQCLRINVEGPLNAIYAVLPAMVARGRGHISAVSSVAAWRGLPDTGPYSASKAALSALMESFRLELAPLGVADQLPARLCVPHEAGEVASEPNL